MNGGKKQVKFYEKITQIIDQIESGLKKEKGSNSLIIDCLKSIEAFNEKLDKAKNDEEKNSVAESFSKDLISFTGQYMFALASDENKLISLTTDLSNSRREFMREKKEN